MIQVSFRKRKLKQLHGIWDTKPVSVGKPSYRLLTELIANNKYTSKDGNLVKAHSLGWFEFVIICISGSKTVFEM